MSTKVDIEKYLRLIQSPQRYIGGEIGSVTKEHDGKLTFALAFPEPYELGMSHTGFRILYNLINNESDMLAERVFCPGTDMIELLEKEDVPLFSLESKTKIKDFDILGFSLQTELAYSNLLKMVDLSNIPLLSKDRAEDDPLIMVGGPVAFNPEPLADFIDIVYLGDAEANLIKMLKLLKDNKTKPREDRLKEAANIEGVYVPSLYTPIYENNIQTGIENKHNLPYPVKKAIAMDIDPHYEEKPMIAWMDLVHDRYGLEIMRGCSRGCRFCLAGYIYRPVRERDPSVLLKQAVNAINCTGLEELGLLSLSTTDYTNIMDLFAHLKSFSNLKHLSLTVPSIRPEEFGKDFFEAIATERKGGLTMAPEAATPRLRAVINKASDNDELITSIKNAISLGWKRVKLYFMIGLPTETDADLTAIIDLCEPIERLLKKVNGRLKVSISPFVPKAHTPFQWEAQISKEEIARREQLLLNELIQRKLRMDLDRRNPFTSFLEGVFARGDRNLGKVLKYAYDNGARFDAWDEIRDEAVWFEAFEKLGISPELYTRERSEDEFLPWEIINCHYPKESLLNEKHKAYKQKYTPNCRDITCSKCNRCDYDEMKIEEKNKVIKTPSSRTRVFGRTARRNARRDIFAKWNFVRLKYSRTGNLRFLSHLDITRLIRRAIRRAELPVAYTQGFHKHEKMSFGPPLPVGYESMAEYIDINLEQPASEEIFEKFYNELPENMHVIDKKYLESGKLKSLTAKINTAIYNIYLDPIIKKYGSTDIVRDSLNKLLEQDEIVIQRPRKEVNIKPFFQAFSITENQLSMKLELSPNGSGRPDEYLIASGIDKQDIFMLNMIRTDTLENKNGVYTDPFENIVPLPEWQYNTK